MMIRQTDAESSPATEVALLPCPFCGGSAGIERKGTAKQSSIIACNDCGCRLETGEIWNIGKRWNTRGPATGGDEPIVWMTINKETGHKMFWHKSPDVGPICFEIQPLYARPAAGGRCCSGGGVSPHCRSSIRSRDVQEPL